MLLIDTAAARARTALESALIASLAAVGARAGVLRAEHDGREVDIAVPAAAKRLLDDFLEGDGAVRVV